MPIGTGAVYAAANLPIVPGNNTWAPMPAAGEDIIIQHPTAPATAIYASNAGWSGQNRCNTTGGKLLTAPLPANYLVPNSRKNNSTAVLAADRRTVLQMQPFTRCSGQAPTSLVAFAPVDLYGDGRTGAHGGSGLSALGGTLRVGELRPADGTTGPRHALKVNVYARQVLGRCQNKSDCYVWPASTADSYATAQYGTLNPISAVPVRMGALLAIPVGQSLDLLGLETEPAKQLAWTLQNYGAYIVDDTGGPGFALNVETGPDDTFLDQFHQDWGFAFEQRVRDNNSWTRDMQRLVAALYVVTNNGPQAIGGGGDPLQPLAAPLSTPN